MDKVLDVYGAYGRNYTNAADAKKDWDEGKDFKIMGGSYLSIRDIGDMAKHGYTKIVIWYGDRPKYLGNQVSFSVLTEKTTVPVAAPVPRAVPPSSLKKTKKGKR